MKRFLASLASVLSLSVLVLSTSMVHAASDWQLKISVPASPLTTSTFNVQYTALSVNANDDFTVSLYQDGVSPANIVGTQSTSGEENGNSGAFAVTAADGHHTFRVVAVRSFDNDTKSADVSVNVDSSAPDAPNYLGKTRTGNSYTVRFTAPGNADVKEVRIYSSTATSFTANGSTQIGTVAVAPGQTASFSYTAGSFAERFHAVRAFDTAGNGSAAVGDPNIVVTTTTVAGGVGANVATAAAANAGAAGQQAAGAGNTAEAGQTLGTSTANGNTNNNSTDSKDKDTKNKNGSVLGTETTKDSNDSAAWATIIAVLVIIGLATYWFGFRDGKNPFKRSQS